MRNNKFKFNIKEARFNAGFTQTELANALGVTQSTVTYWENGTNVPTSENIAKIAEIFGCRIDELYDDEGDTAVGYGFSGFFKALRLQAGKSVEETADALGVSKGAVVAWEKGESVPAKKFMGNIADVLDCKEADLLRKAGMLKVVQTVISGNLKVRRLKVGILSDEVSKMMKISQAKYSDWENSYSVPSEIELERLAEVLECTVDDLTGGSKPELPSEMDGITDAFIKAAELFVKTLKTRQLARKASNE